jgi:RNA polymerase sigma-70 factor (family 1)
MGTAPLTDEQELLLLLKNGSEQAYQTLYNRYNALLYVHAYRKLKNQEEAKDVVQDIFLSIWERRARLNITDSLSAYLYRAVRYKVIDHIAERKDTEAFMGHFQAFLNSYMNTHSNQADHLVRERILCSIIDKEISQLPPKMRIVFELSRKSELSHKEIAEQLNISEQTVRSHVKNALHILKLKLGMYLIVAIFFHS